MDEYYSRTEVSNSMLTELKRKLYPDFMSGVDCSNALRLGTLVDALVTEPLKCDHIRHTVDENQYTDDEWVWGKAMRDALYRSENPFIDFVLNTADKQKVMVNKEQCFEYQGVEFTLDTRCKWDFWLGTFGGDLKTTAATTQKQFEECIDTFDWDRSRAWYMDIAGSAVDFIVAISKKNQRIFVKQIERGDEIYNRGKEKYLELAFKYWTLKI